MPRSHSSTSSVKTPSKSPGFQEAPKFHSPIGPIMSSSNMNKTPTSYTRSEEKPSNIPPANSSGFFASVKEGVALGIGSSLGNRIVSGVFGAPTIQTTSPASAGSNAGSNPTSPVVYGSTAGKPCEVIQTTFNTCIQERKPVEECEKHLDLLNKCLSS